MYMTSIDGQQMAFHEGLAPSKASMEPDSITLTKAPQRYSPQGKPQITLAEMSEPHQC